jgi:hypothetical protein
MNITLNTLAYNLRETISKNSTDDFNLDIRQIKTEINNARAFLLRRRFSNAPFVNVDPILTLQFRDYNHGAKTTTVDSSIITDVTVNKKVLTTYSTIPKILEKYQGIPAVYRLGPSDRSLPAFKIVTPQRALYSGNGKFNRNVVYAFYLNDKFYFYSKSGDHLGIKYIDLIAVPENPSDSLWHYGNYNTPRDIDNLDYPVTRSLADEIQELVYNNFLRQVQGATQDNDNNSRNDT